jgi:tetratricopeptide (TPR) repeat protein
MREEIVVIRALVTAVILGCGLAAGVPACAHAADPAEQPAASQANAQNQPQAPSQKQSAAPQPAQQPASSQPGSSSQSGAGANPFPEDESTVPIMPTKNAPDVPVGNASTAPGRNPENWGALFPAGDLDPVQSPDNAPSAEGPQQGFSSSDSGVDSLLPPPSADADTGKKHGKGAGDDVPSVHPESAAEDENVGKYYLDNKDWRAALSRYESALVLDPDNPDVYWGLAESQRHLGQFADARTNYLKVMEYDPGSRHAKDAKKALEEPELANAKPASRSSQ